MKLDCPQNLDTILASKTLTQQGELMWSLKVEENLHLELLYLLHIYSDFETWIESLCDPDSKDIAKLMGWDNSRANPVVRNENAWSWECP